MAIRYICLFLAVAVSVEAVTVVEAVEEECRTSPAVSLIQVAAGVQRLARQEATSNSSWPDLQKAFGLFGKRQDQDKPRDYDDIFMRFMPKHNLVVCGCAKCGTSSLYEFIYKNEFQKDWKDTYGGTSPYVHEVESDRWGDKFRMVSSAVKQADIMKSAYSFALIRDPRERLLSAWKSKIACGCGGEQCDFYTDVATRPFMVKTLVELADANVSTATQEDGKCMDLDQFLRVISKVHQLGKARQLDRHFLPMGMGCFYDYPPSNWSKIVTLKRPGSLTDLAKKIGSNSSVAPESHASTGKVKLSAESVALLDEITEPEYDLVGEFLNKEKSYLAGESYPLKPGIWA